MLLCGIPASGKSVYATLLSTAVQQLKEAVRTCWKGPVDVFPSLVIDTVSFDQVLREMMVANDNQFTPELWHDSRGAALRMVEAKLAAHSTPTSSVERPICRVVVIDDNMNYRSMRSKVFQLCQTRTYSSQTSDQTFSCSFSDSLPLTPLSVFKMVRISFK